MDNHVPHALQRHTLALASHPGGVGGPQWKGTQPGGHHLQRTVNREEPMQASDIFQVSSNDGCKKDHALTDTKKTALEQGYIQYHSAHRQHPVTMNGGASDRARSLLQPARKEIQGGELRLRRRRRTPDAISNYSRQLVQRSA